MVKYLYCEVRGTLTIDCWLPKSNVFISGSKWMLVPNSKEFPAGVEENKCSLNGWTATVHEELKGHSKASYFRQI